MPLLGARTAIPLRLLPFSEGRVNNHASEQNCSTNDESPADIHLGI
jgi:hypothetical protein